MKIEEIKTSKLSKRSVDLLTEEVSIFGELNIAIHDSKLEKIREIITNPVYSFSCLAISNLLFISTAIIFWTSDYFHNVLNANSNQILGIFVFISLTGPILGIFFGGAVVQKYANGYESKSSIVYCLIFSVSGFLSSIPVGFIDNIWTFSLCLWSILFFGGAVIPNIQGIMISSLTPDLRASGNSISNTIQNLLGFLPAPIVYGLIYDKTKGVNPKIAMVSVLLYSVVGMICIGLVLFYRYKNWEEYLMRMVKFNGKANGKNKGDKEGEEGRESEREGEKEEREELVGLMIK